MAEFFRDLWDEDWVQRVLVTALVLVLAVILWRLFRHVQKAYKKRKGDGMGSASSIMSVVFDTIKVAIIFLVILVILQVNGVNVTSLVAGVGVVGAVLGLALQDFLKDIIMGIHVLMDDFFQIGELVQFDGLEGTVISFNLRTTKIQLLANGDILTLCNRNIDRITRSSTEIYVRIPLAYDLPVGRSAEVMEKICRKTAEAEHITECRFLGTTEFESSSVLHLVRVDIDDPKNKLSTRRSALLAAREVLEDEGIPIPYDQLDVHLDQA